MALGKKSLGRTGMNGAVHQCGGRAAARKLIQKESRHSRGILWTLEAPLGRERIFFQPGQQARRAEEHTSELQSPMRISYAVFGLTKQTRIQHKRQAYDRQSYTASYHC